jgi:flavin-dependent dehydrogenase
VIAPHDICVVGGGPAASVAAGDLAALGYDVVVAGCSTPARVRPIESITPLAISLLEARGVWSDRSISGEARGVGTSRAVGGAQASPARDPIVDAASRVEWPLPSSSDGVRVSLVRRSALDAALRSCAERRGARFVESREPWRAARPDAVWIITSCGCDTALRARFLVAATGRTPLLPSHRLRQPPGLTAVAGFWSSDVDDLEPSAIVRAHEGHWSWVASWPGVGVSAIAFFSPTDPRLRDGDWRRNRLDALVHSALGRAFPSADSIVVSDASAFRDAEPVGAGWVKAGDHALAVEPITNQGLQLALQSGAIAAACANTLLQRPGDLPLVASFLADRHRAIADLHRRLSAQSYAEVAAARPGSAFWTERCAAVDASASATPAHAPSPPRTTVREVDAGGDRLVLNPSARATRLGTCVGAEIVAVEGVMHDGLSAPLVYLDDVHVPPLLRRLDAQTRVADALDHWSAEIGTHKAAQVLAWLLRRDVVRIVPSA